MSSNSFVVYMVGFSRVLPFCHYLYTRTKYHTSVKPHSPGALHVTIRVAASYLIDMPRSVL